MSIRFQSSTGPQAADREGDVAVLIWEDEPLDGVAADLDSRMGGSIGRLLKDPLFRPRPGKTAQLRAPSGIAARMVVVVGCGPREDAEPKSARLAGAAAATAFGKAGGTILAGLLENLDGGASLVAELALGAGLRAYRFDKYLTGVEPGADEDPEPDAGPVTVALEDAAAAEREFEPRTALLAGVRLTRDLVNEPANELGTAEFVDHLLALRGNGLEVEALGEADLQSLGMRALLAVGQGSARESRVVVMRWNGSDDASAAPVVLAGKGVVFDTGGISLKPAKGMEEMTMDMGGAAVVAGTMLSLASRRAKANVVGIVGLVENMPDGCAQRPGDIVRSMSGKTVQVNNTDAEGRLVLADVLWYAQERFKPCAILDFATLTGAMMIALGKENAGFFANDNQLAEALLEAAMKEGEGLWRMPLGKGYAKALKSPIADLKNVSDSPWGGAITAAEFLHAFVRDGVPWAHFDIAGTTKSAKDLPLAPKGATGWGVLTIDRMIRNRYEDK